jgi:hypothetical protein
MDNGPCIQAERDLDEAINEEFKAHEAVTQLRDQIPVGDNDKVQKWRNDIAEAIQRETHAQEVRKEKNDAFLKCKEENGLP